jgi:hypothetical protein
MDAFRVATTGDLRRPGTTPLPYGVAAAERFGLRDPDESGIVPRVDETVNSGRCLNSPL